MRFNLVFLLLIAFAVSSFAQVDNEHFKLKNEGNAAYRNKEYQKALDTYEEALKVWPPDEIMDAQMIYLVADCARRLKDDEKALLYFSRSLELEYNPDNSSLYMASALRALNREDEMEMLLLKSVERFQEGAALVQMKKMLVTHYMKKGAEHFNRASEILKTAAGAKPEQYDEITKRANDSFSEAKPWFEKVLEIESENEDAAKRIAEINNRIK